MDDDAMLRVFVSYTRRDEPLANTVADFIRQIFPGAGADVFSYLEPGSGVNSTEELLSALKSQIESCDLFLYVRTSSSDDNKNCAMEFGIASSLSARGQRQVAVLNFIERDYPPHLNGRGRQFDCLSEVGVRDFVVRMISDDAFVAPNEQRRSELAALLRQRSVNTDHVDDLVGRLHRKFKELHPETQPGPHVRCARIVLDVDRNAVTIIKNATGRELRQSTLASASINIRHSDTGLHYFLGMPRKARNLTLAQLIEEWQNGLRREENTPGIKPHKTLWIEYLTEEIKRAVQGEPSEPSSAALRRFDNPSKRYFPVIARTELFGDGSMQLEVLILKSPNHPMVDFMLGR